MKVHHCYLLLSSILFHLMAFATSVTPTESNPISDSGSPSNSRRSDLHSIKLHTGAEIWINDETEIKTSISRDGIYNIEDKGEIYVRVPANCMKLFVYTAYRDTVEIDPGSEANIKAYQEDDFYRTTAVSGRVIFKRLGRTRVLKPGETMEFNHGKDSLITDVGCEWRDSMQFFDATPNRVIFNTFSRHYHAQVYLDCKKFTESRGNMNYYFSFGIKSLLNSMGSHGAVYDVTQPKENYYLLICGGKCKKWVF